MRLEITNLDEKVLPCTDQFEIYKVLNKIRELVKQRQAHAGAADSDQVMDDPDIESKLMIEIKKLVDSSLWKAPRIQLSALADIFNVIGEKLEKWQEIKSREELIMLLTAANLMISKSIVDSSVKGENIQDIVELVQKSDDVLALSLAIDILAAIPQRTMPKLGSRIEQFALGSNLLISPEHYYTLSDYATGQNNKSESLKNSDLKFDYEVEPQGLNERVSKKSVVISRQDIVSNPKSAQDLSKDIAEQYNKGSDEEFRLALEVKIILCRYIVDDQTTKDAFMLKINSILLANLVKRTEQNNQLQTYLKDNFINECIGIITTWSDASSIIKILQIINKILSRDQMGLVSTDPFLKVTRSDQDDDQEGREPLLIQFLDDITVFEDSSDNLQQSSPQTKLINIEVARNGDFQMALLNIVIMVYKQLQQISNRQTQSYIEIISNIVERLIRILEKNANSNNTYSYSIRLQHMAGSLLKNLVRSRHEEPLNIVHRFEKKILFEIDNLETKFTYKSPDGVIHNVEQKDRQNILKTLFQILCDLIQRDVNNTGVSRKVLESQIFNKVVEVCKLNNEEKGSLVDDFLIKSIELVGMVCYESPANVPTLIKNGVIPAIFKSLEGRLPINVDVIGGTIQSLYQMVLHQEGQDLFKTTSIFEKLIESAMDEKLCQQIILSDQTILRQYLCSFYDRNPECKETTRAVIAKFMERIKTTASKITIQYLEINRKSDLTAKERQEEQTVKLQADPTLQQAQGGLFMLLILIFPQNDRVSQFRHTADIITEDIFKQLLEVFELFAISEISSINQLIPKIIKQLTDQQIVGTYVQVFVQNVKTSIKKLSNLLGDKIEKVKNLDALKQNNDAQMIEIGQFQLQNSENILTKTEQLQINIKIIDQYVKTFLLVPSATKQVIISTMEFDQELRTLFYFQRILFRERGNLLLESINDLSKEPLQEDLKAYNEVVIGKKLKDEVQSEKLEKNKKVQEFLDTYIDTQGLRIKKDLQMFDLIHKIASYSTLGNRSARAQRQDVQKKNCQIIGKFIYKMTKGFKSAKSSKVPLEPNDKQLLSYLYQIQINLTEINNCLLKRELDGLSFYEFYKSGGLNNLLDIFQWLTSILQVIDSDWQRIFHYLFEDSCFKIKEILVGIILTNKIDNAQNAFLEINMTNEFDSPKHFFSNVFNTFCQSLLQGQFEKENPLVKTYKENFNYLQEIVIQILIWASNGFAHCVYIKESLRAEQRGRPRGQPDPAIVQNLVEMGFGREQASAALLQHGSMELATEYLLQNMPALNDNFQNAVDDLGRVSSDDSDDQQLGGIDVVNYESSVFDRAERVQKVTIDTFKENTHKVQVKGYDWMLEAQILEKVSNIKAKDVIYSTLIQEKEPEQQKFMFKKLADMLKKTISLFEVKILNAAFDGQSSLADNEKDHPMEEVKENTQSSDQQLLVRLYQDLQLLQKVVIKEKTYSKESIRQDIYKESVSLLEKILKQTQNQNLMDWIAKDKKNGQALQTIIFELLLLQFTMIQFVQLDILAAQNEIAKKIDPKNQSDVTLQREKKNKEYKLRVCSLNVFEICLKILNMTIANYQQQDKYQFQKPIIILSIVLLLKGVTDEDIQKEKRTDLIAQAFQILSSIKVNDGIDIKLITSFALFSFQEPTVNLQTYEKLIQRVLKLKFDDSVEQHKKAKKALPEDENSLTSVSYIQFLNYFKLLASRDKAIFQKAMSNMCEVKASKKQGKVVQETAQVRLKGSVLSEITKQSQKDRPLLKQLIKAVDIQNDAQFKKQAKISKSSLSAQATEDITKTLNVLINNLYESTAIESQSISTYFEFLQQKQPYIVQAEAIKSTIPEAFKNLELLASLTMAYPQATVAILQHQFQNKKSFVQWFVQEFLVCYLLQKKHLAQPLEADSQITNYEISYEFKTDSVSLDSSIAKVINLLAGYNHLLSFNEILTKHEIRQKLVNESMQTLQKTIKSKKAINPLKQRATIASCLMVVDSLINYEAMQASKHTFAAKENYYNSIRALIVRDSSSSQVAPPSFIKIANELMNDTIDVTSKLNSEIIRKTISIFKTFSDFINSQKKKIKLKERQRKPTGEVNANPLQQNEEEKDNVVMVPQINEDLSQQEDDDHMENEEDPLADDSEEDNNVEDDQEDNDDEGEDDDDDDESILNDQFNQGDDQDDDDDDEDIDHFDYRLDADADLQEDVDSDDEDIFINAGDDDRVARQQDIVAINDRDLLNIIQMQQNAQGNRRLVFQDVRGVRQNDWSNEEQEVQRLLVNMRGMLSQRPQAQGSHLEQIVGYRGQQANASVPKNLIEQMFENLNTISEQEILELVLRQRHRMEMDVQTKVQAQAIDVPAQPQLVRREVMQPGLDHPFARMFGNEEAQIISIQERLGDIQMLLNQHQQNIIDPLYGRAWHQFGAGVAPGNAANIVSQGILAGPQLVSDLGLFSRLLRNSQQNTLENINDSLLNNEDINIIEVEEVKDQGTVVLEQERARLDSRGQEQQVNMRRQEEEMAIQREQLLLQHSQFQQAFLGLNIPQQPQFQASNASQLPIDDQLLLFSSLGADLLQAPLNNPAQQPAQQQVDQQQQQIQPSGQINVAESSAQQVDVGMQQQEQRPEQSQDQDQVMEVVSQQQDQQQEAQQVEPVQSNQQVQQQTEVQVQANEESKEEQKVEAQTEELKQEEEEKEKPQQQEASDSGKTFGYDNELLLANDIDPAILHELPEDVRAELLSSIDVQVRQQQQQNSQETEQREVSSLADPNPNPNPAGAEEQKEGSAQQQQQQPSAQNQAQNINQSDYTQIANELGLDPTFLESIPEEFRRELIDNELMRNRNLGQQQQQQQPHREAEQMDLASFIATVTDPNLRAEILTGLDEASLASLPPNLMAEARRIHDQVRSSQYERLLARQMMEEGARGGHAHGHGLGHGLGRGQLFDAGRGGRGGRGGRLNAEQIFGRNFYRGGEDYELQRAAGHGDQALDYIVNKRHRELAEEQDNDDSASALQSQLGSDEKLIDQLLVILCGNDTTECTLIPLLDSLIKIQNSNGQLAIRNKIINAITFILKCITLDETEALKIMLPNITINKNRISLILIGTLRIMIRNNKKLIQHILKGLINKEDYFKSQGNHTLKRQQKAILVLKAEYISQPSLAEIFSLAKTEMFKQDKILMKNLSILIHQVLKQFDVVIEDLGAQSQQISKESVESLAEILSLEIIDFNLMQALGEFLYQVSKKKRQNFELISDYCENRSNKLLDKLNDKLEGIGFKYENLKLRLSPNRSVSASELAYSQHDRNQEEEKLGDTQIDTSAVQTQVKQLKLSDEEEKSLKQALKITEDSEILLRIFKLFNLFYEKFSIQENEPIRIEETQETLQKEEVIDKIKRQYNTPQINQFVQIMNDVLRIIQNANIDIQDSVSNLILCVFASFFPEVSEAQKVEENKTQVVDANSNKFNVTMLPIGESLQKNNAEKFVLFKKFIVVTPKLQDLSIFCQKNKKIINKLIKTKSNILINEMDYLIKYMPNLLDFENKRAHFKLELAKLKKSQYHQQIQLFIRRDDIFMDSFAQINIRSADEMKGKLHISFTGERGQDAGGLTRDFFIELSREIFNANYSLFNLSSNGSAYFPNPRSYVEKDHLRYFKFIGRVIGKALLDECLLECYFVKSLYKVMTGEPLNFYDLEDFDNEFFNNLKWCLDNDVESLMATFSIEQDFFGKTEEIELKEGGKKIPVTNENKNEYVEKLTYFKLYKNIQKQIDAFLDGFYELIPKELVSIFNHKELELIISGLPNFDIDDLKANTEYQGYQANSPQVQWLWEILESFENSERAEFLQFVTGSSKVPVEGFRGLMGMRGPQRFTIAKIKTDDILRLPSGHTCFNQIDIPEYPSKEIMHERVMVAIKETKGFGFA